MFNCNKNGQIITASHGILETDDYHCPECKAELVLRAGAIRHPYFAHKIFISCIHHDSLPAPINHKKDITVNEVTIAPLTEEQKQGIRNVITLRAVQPKILTDYL